MNHSVFSPEFQRLCGAIGHEYGFAPLPPAPRTFDWQRFVNLCSAHGLASWLTHHAATWQALEPPETARRALTEQARLNTMRALAMTAELERLAVVFGKEELRFVPFKGIALSQLHYNSAAVRQVGDLDILVRPRDVLRADSLLNEAGYQRTDPQARIDQASLSWWLRNHKEFKFRRSVPGSGPLLLELQWALSTWTHLIAADAGMEQAQNLTIGRTQIAGLEPGLLHTYLHLHGSSSLWASLKWLVDVLQHERRFGRKPLPEALQRVQAQFDGLARDLFLRPVSLDNRHSREGGNPVFTSSDGAMELDARLRGHDRIFGVWPGPEPSAILMRLPLQTLSDSHRAAPGKLRALTTFFLYELQLARNWRHKLQVLRSRLLRPGDVALIPLPRPLYPLYFFLRPFAFVYRLLKRGA